MSFNETQMAFGSWDVVIEGGEKGVPQELLDVLLIKDEPDASLGHIIITPTHVDPREVDPLTVARYTGVYRRNEFTETQKRLSGSGLVYWLGDEQDHGPEIPEVAQELDNVSFVDAITAVLPAAIEVGTIVPEIGVQDYIFLFETARTRINEICSRYNAEYYITPQGTLNAGTPASLYPTFNAPTCFITRKNEGADPQYKQLPLASAALGGDATNFATRQVNVATVDDEPTIVGEAEESTGKRDLHGNLVTITNVSGESQPDAINGDARAAALLAQAMQPRKSNRLSTAKYDIDGTLAVGDSVYVYDPESGYVDTANKVEYRGQYYFPAKVRVQAVTWPLSLNEDGSKPGVYFREPKVGIDPLEEITHDLTPYVVWENQGNTEVVVGALARSIIPLNPAPLGPIVNPVVNPEAPPPIPDPPTIFSEERSVLVKQPTTSGGLPMPATVSKYNVYASTSSGFTPGPTNYIGYISVTRADVITLGIPLLKSFKWETDDLTYFRTTAMNGSTEGPASIEVAETAGLIVSAAILNLDAEKINAGTINVAIELNAAVINGAEINGTIMTMAAGGTIRGSRTTAPYNHYFIDEEGIFYYKDGTAPYTGGDPAFSMHIGDGQLQMWGGTITGAIYQTSTTFPKISINDIGEGPDFINFYPAADTAEPGYIWGTELGTGGNRLSILSLASGSVDGGGAQQARVDLYSADVDNSEPSIGRFVADRAILQGLVGVADGAYVEAFGATIIADSTQDAGFNITDQVDLVADGFVQMMIKAAGTQMSSDLALDDYIMHLRGFALADDFLRWNGSIDGPHLRGAQRFLINCNVADAEIYGDGGRVYVQTDGGTAGIPVVASDYEIWSDERIKANRTKRTGMLAELRQTPVWEYDPTDPDGKAQGGARAIGLVAQEAPADMRVPMKRRDKEGEDFEGLSLRSYLAYLWGGLTEEAEEREALEERVTALESASDDRRTR